MKFDTKALKLASAFLPKTKSHPIVDMLKDDHYSNFYDQFISPTEDLFYIVVFGVSVGEFQDTFNCPGNDDGTKPVEWDNGSIRDKFDNYMNSNNLNGMIDCVNKLEKIYNDFKLEKK